MRNSSYSYGFYENFENIDSKIRISGERGVDSGVIINKVKELGITDQKIEEKLWRCLSSGVELEAHVPIRINRKDASVSYMYN